MTTSMPTADLLPDFLAAQAEARPDATCWIYGDRTWTWDQAWQETRRIAGALRAAGIGHGDRVAFVDKNNPAILEVLLGGALIGSAVAIVNWRLAPDEIDYTVNDSGARLLFVGHELADQVLALRDQLTTVEHIIVVGGEQDEFETWVAAGEPVDLQPDVSPDDTAVVMYSSGTTGRPKGVQLSHRNLIEHTRNAVGDIAYDPDVDMMLIAMPMFHVGGTSYALFGVATGTPGYIIREVEPGALLAAAQAGVTHVFLVPAVVAGLLNAGPDAMRIFAGLKHFVYGAAPMPLPILQGAIEHWPTTQFHQVYGLTELAGVITVLDDADHRDPDHPERLLSAGRPVAAAEVRVVDPATGAEVPTGEPGELWFRSPQATTGYLGRPEATAALLTEDGWLRTGDIGRVDEHGFVFVDDRAKDMIITGGENVYSPEVERVLTEHPDVAEAAVIGIPDERWGESVKAVVALLPDRETTAEELISFTRERLAGYKTPKSIDIVEALPRNPSGKILKRDLRQPFWADQGRQI